NLLAEHTNNLTGMIAFPEGKRYIPLASIHHTNWLNTLLAHCKASAINYTLEDVEQGSTIYPFELALNFSAAQEVNEVYHLKVSAIFGNCKLSLEELKDWLFRRKSI